jgi:hypothetical protein
MDMPSGHIVDYPPEATGRTSRAVQALVPFRTTVDVETFPATVPKGTRVGYIANGWWVLDLAWLEQLLEQSLPKGFGRTSAVYHGARHYGIELDAEHVEVDQ